MINILMNQKRGLNSFSKLPDDGDPWAPNNFLKPGAKEKHPLNSGGPGNRQEAPYIYNVKKKVYLSISRISDFSKYHSFMENILMSNENVPPTKV